MSCDLIANLDVVRVTKVDECGAPIAGENAFIAECNASVAMTASIDTQDDIIYRAANGKLCGVKRGCPSLLGYDLEYNFYSVSPQLLDVLTGQPTVLDSAGEVIGFDSCDIQCDGGFAFEFWAELVGQNCTDTGTARYLYVLMPWVTNSYLGDLTIGSEAVSLQVLGSTRAGGNWGTGPWNVQAGAGGAAGPMLTPLGDTCHRRMMITTIAPPTPDPACDYTTVVVPPPAPIAPLVAPTATQTAKVTATKA